MMLSLRWPLLCLGVAGWVLVAIPACTGEVAEESVLSGQRDTGEADLESDRVVAGQGEADAQVQLAVESDRALAEQGDAGAQARLGEAYYVGRGVALDLEEAVRWARLAAEQGDARGQGVLAAAYNTGRGVTLSFEEAVRWARLAAEQGDASAQTLLGMMYINGRGVEQDDVSAYMWLTLGASGRGVGGARETRDLVATRMTPELIAEAEARVRDWGK